MRYHTHKQFRIYRQRGLFLRVGFALTLLLVILAFSWKTERPVAAKVTTVTPVVDVDDKIIHVVFPEKKKQKKQVLDLKQEVNIDVTNNSSDADPSKLPLEDPNFDEVLGKGMPTEDAGFIPVKERIFKNPEVMPRFPGGNKAFQQYINANIQFPYELQQSGKVEISFVIDEEGNVTGVEIARASFAPFNREAKRVIEGSPRWIPGKMGDRPVKVIVTIPINFIYR